MRKTRIFCDGKNCTEDITDQHIIIKVKGSAIDQKAGKKVTAKAKPLEYCAACAKKEHPKLIDYGPIPKSIKDTLAEKDGKKKTQAGG